MIEVRELTDHEIDELLARVGYGHLACSRDSVPYVVPVQYAWDGRAVFLYTTEGRKSDTIAENPNVCLQVEDVEDNRHWCSVIVEGVAERLDAGDERAMALKMIMKTNPTLTPAISIHWLDDWVKQNVEVVYRIKPTYTSGRASVPGRDAEPFARKPKRPL